MIVGHVDPAVHGHAMAVGYAADWRLAEGINSPLLTYEPGELLEAAYAHSEAQRGRGPHVWSLTCAAFVRRFAHWMGRLDAMVVEVPQVYAGKGEGDPNDLIQIAGSLGVMLGAFRVPVVVGRYPSEWTGGGKKPPRHARARASLSPAELARVEEVSNKKDREDLWDAIALQRKRAGGVQVIHPG